MGAAQLASKLGAKVFLSEYGTFAEDKASSICGVSYEDGGHSEQEILSAEVIKSPGILIPRLLSKRLRHRRFPRG